MKVLVTRTDRLGDLMLSLPVFEYLNRALPDWEVQALVAPTAVPLLENNPFVQGIWTWTDQDSDAAQAELMDRLKQEHFSAVIMLQYRRELARLLKGAGIKRRHGPWSRFSSWFLLNRGSWQGRAHSARHEMEQNLRLARHFLQGAAKEIPFPAPRLFLTEGQLEIGREFRREFGIEADKVVFLHPGSGGSALDWDSGRFAAVANALHRMAGFQVFLTGSRADREKIEPVRAALDFQVGDLVDRYPLREFLGVLAAGDYFVGPSTGPLHMAAALGLGTVGLFPPVATMSAGRWGQQGKYCRTITPAVRCPESRYCRGNSCPLFNCMDGIFERDVLGAVLELHGEKTAAALDRTAAGEEES